MIAPLHLRRGDKSCQRRQPHEQRGGRSRGDEGDQLPSEIAVRAGDHSHMAAGEDHPRPLELDFATVSNLFELVVKGPCHEGVSRLVHDHLEQLARHEVQRKNNPGAPIG